MFVRRSTYNEARWQCENMRERALNAERKFYALNEKWNALVSRINAKGGENFLENATIPKAAQFAEDDLTKLILLCHPDKHDGKPIATEMTQKLLALKGAAMK